MQIAAPASVATGEAFTAVLQGTSNAVPARGLIGFQALLTYDASRVSVTGTDFTGTVWENADFQSATDDGAGSILIGVVLDQDGVPPVVVAAGVDLDFLNIDFDAGSCAASVTTGFTGTIDDNLLADEDLVGHDTGNGLVLTPATTAIGTTGTFVRGNAKNDTVDTADPPASVDLADAMFILESLFQNGPPLECLDAADANDDGRINIMDPITIYQFLLGNLGPTLAEPYTVMSTDPTPDTLDCAVSPPVTGCP